MRREMGIDYRGFEFYGVSLIPESFLNEQAEILRFQILEQEPTWLRDGSLALRMPSPPQGQGPG